MQIWMPNFQVREFSVNAKFLQVFWWIAQISAEIQKFMENWIPWKLGEIYKFYAVFLFKLIWFSFQYFFF